MSRQVQRLLERQARDLLARWRSEEMSVLELNKALAAMERTVKKLDKLRAALPTDPETKA